MNAPLIGACILRKEDYRFLTGAGQYTDDVTLPNQAYAVFVRSPHAHAKIKKISTEKAKKSSGVLGVFRFAMICTDNPPEVPDTLPARSFARAE